MKKTVQFFIVLIFSVSLYAEAHAGLGMNWNLMTKDDYRYIWLDDGDRDKLHEPVIYNRGIHGYHAAVRYFHPLAGPLDFEGGANFSFLPYGLSFGMSAGAGIRILPAGDALMRISGNALCGSGVYSSWSFFWGGALDLTLEYLFSDSLGIAVNIGLEYRAYPSVKWWDLQLTDVPMRVSVVVPGLRLW